MKVYLAAVDKTVEVDENVWIICSDSVCEGYQPILEEDENGNSMPITFKTEEEAIQEIDDDPEFYEGCFPCQISEIGHKTILK